MFGLVPESDEASAFPFTVTTHPLHSTLGSRVIKKKKNTRHELNRTRHSPTGSFGK